MIVRPITDQTEAFATYRIVGELMADKTIEPGVQAEDMALTNRLVQQLLSNPRFLLVGAFDERGAALGYICGEVRQDIYTNQICAFELIWAVGDRYRKSGVGLALLAGWEAECKKMGAVKSYMGCGAFCHPEILRGLYPKIGYQLHSESYFKIL